MRTYIYIYIYINKFIFKHSSAKIEAYIVEVKWIQLNQRIFFVYIGSFDETAVYNSLLLFDETLRWTLPKVEGFYGRYGFINQGMSRLGLIIMTYRYRKKPSYSTKYHKHNSEIMHKISYLILLKCNITIFSTYLSESLLQYTH